MLNYNNFKKTLWW